MTIHTKVSILIIFGGILTTNASPSFRTKRQTQECSVNNDIAFILDSSGSVAYDNFEIVKDTVGDFLATIVTASGNHASVLTFSTSTTVNMYLDEYVNGSAQAEAVRRIPYSPGTTDTAGALRRARTDVFRSDSGDRSDARNVIVLFTDGGSNHMWQTLEQAVQMKLDGIYVIVVAITTWVNMDEIRAVATEPLDRNILMAERFSELGEQMDELKSLICSDVKYCTPDPCLNNGTCVERMGGYICRCPPGFAGKNCDRGCKEGADLAIVIDSSSSMNQGLYFDMLRSIQGFVRQLPIAEDVMRASFVTYANDVEMRLSLKQTEGQQNAADLVMFPFSGGTTNTAEAINSLYEQVFQEDSGDRAGVRDVAVVFTDGRSNDRPATFRAAARARERGIHIIVVGLGLTGFEVINEMNGIASDPNEQNVINLDSVRDFLQNASTKVVPTLIEAVCNNVNDCIGSPCHNGGYCVDNIYSFDCICPDGFSGRYCERRCDGALDLVFAVDVSGSIRFDRFHMIQAFIGRILDDVEIRSNRTRVGALTFSDRADVSFHLGDFYRKEDVIQSVMRMPYRRGRTNLAEALKVMRGMFHLENGARFNIPQIGVIITDGVPTEYVSMTAPEATRAKIDGIELKVVVAEADPSNLMYQAIASYPEQDNIFHVERFSQLSGISRDVVKSFCNDHDDCASRPCDNRGRCIDRINHHACLCPTEFTGWNCERLCLRRYDVVFVLDASGSTDTMFSLGQRFAREVVMGLNFNGGRSRVGVVTFSDEAIVRFPLDRYLSQLEVMNAIAFPEQRGRTNTVAGIDAAYRDVLISASGERPGDDNIMIIVTDGNSNVDEARTVPMAREVARSGVRVMVAAVGRGYNSREVTDMASYPEYENVVYLPDESGVAAAASTLLDRLCFN